MADWSQLSSQTKDVPLVKMRVNPRAQREFKQFRVDYLTSVFDPEMFGLPVVNLRAGHWYIVDGNHRIKAVMNFLGDTWQKQSVTCRCYNGLTEKEEAQMFLDLNDNLGVKAFDKFMVAITAEHSTETAIKKIVEKCGLSISRTTSGGGVNAVTTLIKVLERSDGVVLARSLRIVKESFGDIGMTAIIIDGMARVCERYNGALDDDQAIERLSSLRTGVNQVLVRANQLRAQLGANLGDSVAGSIVDALNSKRGGKKLPSWWKE